MRATSLERRVLDATRRALARRGEPLVLAVSGGCDSMALLDAVLAVAPRRIAAAATFDHGTGPAARRAVGLVGAACAARGVRLERGGGVPVGTSEAAWRDARWAFLRAAAARHGAVVATAHTRDDHLETVLMRVLRGSGARGLAGLHAESAVVRPFLAVDRGTVRAFALRRKLAFADDPTNESRRYLRNRIRLDLLPALERVRPAIGAELLALSERAAAVRSALDAVAAEVSVVTEDGRLAVAAPEMAGYSRESLSALWPAMAARVGLALDRRGTERVVAFTIESGAGRRVQVSGGWELYRSRERFELVRGAEPAAGEAVLARGRGARFGGWRFAPGVDRPGDPWTAVLAADATTIVRTWRAGDRMQAAGSARARRVKRFLSDARVSAADRARWPVVVADGEVVWIPGVRRGRAATARPGRPEVTYTCDFDDGE
ncbi:MAG: tRNA lysidine(34) synthetase TilS [Gemmatimonadota bacterium]|nr:tRNA lysidine(34) synthetase TilS [Gemmatimonadota bacterium]MDE3215690.1 tRNA lysidine(34) synthetase TilS [Gemmatimonadota bacterium]